MPLVFLAVQGLRWFGLERFYEKNGTHRYHKRAMNNWQDIRWAVCRIVYKPGNLHQRKDQ